MTEQELQAKFNDQFATLAHKHASVSYLLIGVVALVLVLAGVGGYIGLKFADAQLARAEKQEATYNTDRKAWQDQLVASTTQRAVDTAKQTAIIKIVDTRDQAANAAITKALAPGATAKQASDGLAASYSDLPAFGSVTASGDGIVQLSVPQAQQATATRIDQKRLTLDLVDTKTILSVETVKNSSLSSDLARCQGVNKEADKTIADYKSAAKVSKWKKVLHGAEIGGTVAVAIITGYKVGAWVRKP